MEFKIKRAKSNEKVDLKKYDLVYGLTRSSSTQKDYFILKNTTKLSEEDLIDIIYPGFNFGYNFTENSVVVYTD